MKTAFLAAILLPLASALAWDPIGHMLVNQIAYDQLTPEAKKQVDAAIATFNEKENADYVFANLGCWMDDIRARTKDYNSWHYVNLPFTADGLPIPGENDGPNVINGADLSLAVLKGEASDEMVPPIDALAIFTHMTGDIHQPLHATSRNEDMGGNRVEISNLKDAQVDLLFSGGGNLHFFWDSAYRRGFKDGKAETLYANQLYPRNKPLLGHKAALPIVRKEATAIEEEFPPSIMETQATPKDWALESHAIGYEFAYGKLPGAEGQIVELDEDYVAEAREIARKRIAMAGYRLAGELNAIFGFGQKK